MGLLALKSAANNLAIACHGRTPGLRSLPFQAVGVIVGLVCANVIVWVAVGVLLVWLLPHFFSTISRSYKLALSCVRYPGRI